MNTIGKDKWPEWVKRAVGKDDVNIEIKEENGKYYAYKSKNWYDKSQKEKRRTSKYLGKATPQGIKKKYENKVNGVYEYGNVALVLDVLNKNKIIDSLKECFPDEWKTIIIFAINRAINPRSIKTIKSWYEKTYLVNELPAPLSPNTISNVLAVVGRKWASQQMFFNKLKNNGEKIIYDGSVIFSSSKTNPMLETGYNKDHLLLPKVNILLAFSHDRFIPVFCRIIPGSIHEINTIDILLEELGRDSILVADRGFSSDNVYTKIHNKDTHFIIPLKRNSNKIGYTIKLNPGFVYRNRPIKCLRYKSNDFFVYVYEDIALKYEEEKTYLLLHHQGKDVDFNEQWAGKIALYSDICNEPEEIYEMWKIRNEVEKAFDVLQNILDTDRPYVRDEETLRGYIFSSFIGLIIYYFILKILKDANINNKISVSDTLLELSKIYKIEINEKCITSEISKKAKNILKKLNIENIIQM